MITHLYHEILLHFNWHTKDDAPQLIPAVEKVVYHALHQRCQKTKGVYLKGIGGTVTHVHLAIAIEPHVTISELVKELKGGSSHDTNQVLGSSTVGWQRGYGVVSFGQKNLSWVLQYLNHQKEHHKKGTLTHRLEISDSEE